MMIYSESHIPLSFSEQLIIGIQQRFCRHHWCEHFHIIQWGPWHRGDIGHLHKFCPKCGKVEA